MRSNEPPESCTEPANSDREKNVYETEKPRQNSYSAKGHIDRTSGVGPRSESPTLALSEKALDMDNKPYEHLEPVSEAVAPHTVPRSASSKSLDLSPRFMGADLERAQGKESTSSTLGAAFIRNRQGIVASPKAARITDNSLHHCADRLGRSSGQLMQAPSGPSSIHTNALGQQKGYLVKVCQAFMTCGAPPHRLESYLKNTAKVIGLHVHSFYMPGCMIISFNNADSDTPEVRIVRATEALDLDKLYDIHAVYKDVIHDRQSLDGAIVRLDDINSRRGKFPTWFRVLMYGLASACIGPVSYGARAIDLPIIFILGSLLGCMELVLAPRSELYAPVLNVSAAIMTSFFARAFGSIDLADDSKFCFAAICQASLVMILPGFTITNSALELQSKNMVSGSVRLVYGVLFILFLSFGITVGSSIYGAMDPGATSATTCATTWPFWWQVAFVVPFTFFYILVFQGRWRKQPAMLFISAAGWLVNHFASERIANNNQISQTLGQTLGALTVGILANLWSRLGGGLAAASMHPAIFIQVPGSLAARGGLLSGINNANQLTQDMGSSIDSRGAVLGAGYSMVEIGIGITVGLSVSALVVYPIRKQKIKSGIFSF